MGDAEPNSSREPGAMMIIAALVLDLAALIVIALCARWHVFSESVTAGALFAVITGQVASKAGRGRFPANIGITGIVLAFIATLRGAA